MKKLTKLMVIVLSLVMVIGCFAMFAACGDDDSTTPTETGTADRVIALQMPNVGTWGDLTGATDTTVVGGMTAGWAVSKKVWGANGASSNAKAAAAFVNFMSQADIINGWAGDDSINPIEGNTIQSDAALVKAMDITKYSSIKMARKESTVALDALIDNQLISSIRLLADLTTKTPAAVKTAFAAIGNKASFAPAAYEAPTKGDLVLPLSATKEELEAEISVFTMYGPGDWQNGVYTAALAAFRKAFPGVTVNASNVSGVDNTVKTMVNNDWTGNNDGSKVPDVISWFSDASAKELQDDAYLTPVASIQAVYKNYCDAIKTEYITKYFTPIVGTYEAMFTNVARLAQLEVIDAGLIKALDSARAAIQDGDLDTVSSAVENATHGFQLTFKNGTSDAIQARVKAMADAQKALYDAAAESVSTWDKLVAVADKAKAANVAVFAQDGASEVNYLVDQAVMLMAGKDTYTTDLSTLDADQIVAYENAFNLINKMNSEKWFPSTVWSGNHEAAKTAFKSGNAVFMIEGSWSRWALGYEYAGPKSF